MWATSTASEFNWRKTGPSETNQDQERWGTKALFFPRHSLLITQDSLTWLGGWCSWLLEMSSAPNENATMWIISSGKHWWLWQLTHQRLGDMVPSLTGLSSYLSKLWDHLESPFLTEPSSSPSSLAGAVDPRTEWKRTMTLLPLPYCSFLIGFDRKGYFCPVMNLFLRILFIGHSKFMPAQGKKIKLRRIMGNYKFPLYLNCVCELGFSFNNLSALQDLPVCFHVKYGFHSSSSYYFL